MIRHTCRYRLSFGEARRVFFREGGGEVAERTSTPEARTEAQPSSPDTALKQPRIETRLVQDSSLIPPALKAEHAAGVCKASGEVLGQPTVDELKAKYSPQLARIIGTLDLTPRSAELRAATPEDMRRSRSPENAARVNAAIRAEHLDASPVGQATQFAFGKKLSDAKQDPLGTLGANTLESGQTLASAIAHPARTLEAIGELITSPKQTISKIADIYHDEWTASNAAGKVGLVWRGLLDFVVVPETAARGIAAVSGRVAATASEVGTVTANIAGQLEKAAPVGRTVGALEGAGIAAAHEKITDAVVAAKLVENARTIAPTSPREAVQQLNSVSPELLRQQPELAQEAYALRQDVLRRNREVFSDQTYTKEGIPGRDNPWEYISDSASWLPERAALQAEVTRNTYEAAIQLSERMPPKTILLLRGNTGSGKTTVLRTEIHPIIKDLRVLDAEGKPSGVINPDAAKASLRAADQLNGQHAVSHYQMLYEGAKIATEVTQQMLIEGRSMVIDKRFLKPQEITEVAEPARAAGYRVIVLDVDASLESSLARVKNRTFEGEDPVVDPPTIERGYRDAVKYRPAIQNMPGIDYFYLKND